ncbi:MAG: prepilin-type N-terminal cleavage/methylation domain-containing protein [Deltaproteobacteria bacterium]|nr:prepilin-type N-terminal cleavage/methylation domain-containing protein [Deltaproteobacteria bacterium]
MLRTKTRKHQGAFTLIECLIALTILALILLLTAAAVGHQERLALDLKLRQRSLVALEAVLESLRKDAVALESGEVQWTAPPPNLNLDDIQLNLDVTKVEELNLYDVEVEASYLLRGQTHRQALQTVIWRTP